jgi:carbon storage regulator
MRIMLVLTRKRTEMIKIGDDIVIKVIQTGRGSVKIGIEAPAHVRVLRAELAEYPVAGAELPAAEVDTVDATAEEQGVERFLAKFDSSGVLDSSSGFSGSMTNGPLRRLMSAVG